MSEETYPSQIHTVMNWIKDERSYQTKKFDYSKDDIEHIQDPDAFDKDKYGWVIQQIMNYLHRCKVYTLELPNGRQALMKAAATLVGMAEAMINVYGLPPEPGHSSGNNYDWKPEKRIYIAGPMTGYEEKNFPAFYEAEEKLLSLGWIPVNPCRNECSSSVNWEDFMKPDLVDMIFCNAVFCLPGWEESKGAKLEVYLAEQLSIPVYKSYDELPELQTD